ncbi:hypothetical protein PYS58_12905 [Chryseobacterium indologenes]|uniref:hypothetical protein n=1 Tax=Chryseobacterium TaxID=59732 RepID=UPI001628AFC0|nr:MULTISPECIES: hypothetical protein [Chryseobacterium]MDM1554379.1 hypothetical protein [Chryseobacterium indologenes]WET47485.1 hypothetical protein PYS58_12905 [Chryseobacterium indologenes]
MKISAIITILLLIGCKSSVKTGYLNNDLQNEYSRKLSPNHQFTLFYRFDDNPLDPGKWLTYYVTESKTNILKKEKTKILADSIDWKSDNVLVIIPYRKMVKTEIEVDEKENDNQILIPIK